MMQTEIGVIAHNEAGNLAALLTGLMAEPGGHRVCIVSSGSTDATDDIALDWAKQHDRIRAIIEPERRGKARAINRFLHELRADTECVVLISGDVLPEAGTLGKLLEPLQSNEACMTGARPCPDNPKRGLIGLIVHFQWDLLDHIARKRPKLGEMVAFRTPVRPIDPESVVDEAALEAQLTADGGSLAYVPSARVRNRGPGTWSYLIAQRERICIGHKRLQARTGYRVTTQRLVDLAGPALGFLIRHPGQFPVAVAAAGVEVWARLRARRSQELPSVWPMLQSTRIQGHTSLKAPSSAQAAPVLPPASTHPFRVAAADRAGNP